MFSAESPFSFRSTCLCNKFEQVPVFCVCFLLASSGREMQEIHAIIVSDPYRDGLFSKVTFIRLRGRTFRCFYWKRNDNPRFLKIKYLMECKFFSRYCNFWCFVTIQGNQSRAVISQLSQISYRHTSGSWQPLWWGCRWPCWPVSGSSCPPGSKTWADGPKDDDDLDSWLLLNNQNDITNT